MKIQVLLTNMYNLSLGSGRFGKGSDGIQVDIIILIIVYLPVKLTNSHGPEIS